MEQDKLDQIFQQILDNCLTPNQLQILNEIRANKIIQEVIAE